MPILLDVNALPSIFDQNAADHLEFAPVLACILTEKKKIPLGGEKFLEELKKMPNYLRLYAELDRRGQIIRLKDTEVDALCVGLIALANDGDFDDEHLIAIIILSRCPVVCTKDARAMRFIKRKALYPKNVPRAAIYSGSRNADLLRLV